MRTFQLSPFARARVTVGALPKLSEVVSDVAKPVVADTNASLIASSLAVECVVARGGRVEYGMLGFEYFSNARTDLLVTIGYTVSGVAWPASLTQEFEESCMGFPEEFAKPVLTTATDFAANRFPAGSLSLVAASYGKVGSSSRFFKRIAIATLSLMIGDSLADDSIIYQLKRDIID